MNPLGLPGLLLVGGGLWLFHAAALQQAVLAQFSRVLGAAVLVAGGLALAAGLSLGQIILLVLAAAIVMGTRKPMETGAYYQKPVVLGGVAYLCVMETMASSGQYAAMLVTIAGFLSIYALIKFAIRQYD